MNSLVADYGDESNTDSYNSDLNQDEDPKDTK